MPDDIPTEEPTVPPARVGRPPGRPPKPKDEEPKKRASRKVKVHAGGHVILADPPPPTPDPIEQCSVCGQNPSECPHGDVGGWAVEEGA
jgi:hypothetical protein